MEYLRQLKLRKDKKISSTWATKSSAKPKIREVEANSKNNLEAVLPIPDKELEKENAVTEQVKQLHFLIEIIDSVGRICGITCEENWKMNYRTYISIMIAISYVLLYTHTLYIYKSELFKILECLSITGILFPVGGVLGRSV